MSPRATPNPELQPSGPPATVNRMIGKVPDTTPYIPYSQIQMFDQCPLHWHLSREYTPMYTPASVVFGEGFHAGVKTFYRARMAGRAAGLDELMGAYNHHWSQATTPGKPPVRFTDQWEDVCAMQDRVSTLFEVFIASARPGEVIAVEEPFSATLATDLAPIVGRIDVMEIRQDDDGIRRLHLVDFKLAARRSVKDDLDTDQFLLFALAAEQAGWANTLGMPLALRFDVVTAKRTLELVSIPPTPVPRNNIDHLIGKIRWCDHAIREGHIYPSSSWACSSCSYGAAQCAQWPYLPTLNVV